MIGENFERDLGRIVTTLACLLIVGALVWPAVKRGSYILLGIFVIGAICLVW